MVENIDDNNNNQYQENSSIPSSFKFSKSFIAGILLIIGGAISLLMWIGLATLDIAFIESTIIPEFESLPAEYGSLSINAESIKEVLVICGSLSFFISIFMILGGLMSIKKRMWKLCLTSSILGLFTIGPFFSSSLISLICLILIIISKKEFQ